MAVYLDYNATTPLDPRVAEAMGPYLTGPPGNPSSAHRFGRAARAALDQARAQVAALVGAQPEQVVFTSGGTEANNLALKGAAATLESGRIAVSEVEHASVLAPANTLGRRGWGIDPIAPDAAGRIVPAAVRQVLTGTTRLVSVMSANNETGVLQALAPLAALVREAGAWMHTDAVQAAGKVPVDFAASGVHLMSLSAHKIGGPVGVGALVVDRTVDLAPLLEGGGQEHGLRGGTENVVGIVGFGAAAALAGAGLETYGVHLRGLRDQLERGLAEWRQAVVFGQGAERLPNTVQFALPGIAGETLLLELDRRGVAVSSGSACHTGRAEPSHVLVAMGVPAELAHCAVRVSFGRDSTAADVDALLSALAAVWDRLRPAEWPTARSGG
ncbi:MAG: cysteine desulfurase [Chromatiales bacterium 21-64-14]|nr:MAG: cysteine desulfurase [Chromatiales bacterium 21-64-14]